MKAFLNFINQFLNSVLGKFFAIGLVWSFSFQMLSEIRHLLMDMGYGFELQTTRITGLIVIFGSFLLIDNRVSGPDLLRVIPRGTAVA